MKRMNYSIIQRGKQRGAVLVISLLLLFVITTLAISGMNTATTELAMARNEQNYEYAFQAAETGLENAMNLGLYVADTDTNLGVTSINLNDEVDVQVRYEDPPTIVPDRAFSLGSGSGIVAYHFLASAQAQSSRAPGSTTDRDSTALHTQAFYKVGPEGPTL